MREDVIESLASTIAIDTSLVNLSKSDLCSPCMLALLVQAQSTAYSNYGPDFVSQYQEIQSSKAQISWLNGKSMLIDGSL